MSAQLRVASQQQPESFRPDREYVASAGLFTSRVGTAISALWNDDAEILLGTGGFERLLTDPEIHKDVTLLVDAILGDGVQLFPLFTDDTTDAQRAALAADYSAFCSLNLFETLRRPFRETLNESVKLALVTGHKMVEQTYRDYTDAEGRPRLVLDKLKCKPRDAAQFVVDPYLNVLGIQVWTPGGQIVVPREKFFIPTFERHDEDPRGSAPAMRAVYNWFVAKRAALPIYVKRLEKKAVPSTVGFTSDKEDDRVQELDAAGNPVTDAAGRAVVSSSAEVMARQLASLDGNSSAAFPHGASVQVLDASGNGEEFTSFFQTCDRQITRAILLQDLATNEGQHGTRAQAVTHMDVLALRVWNLKNIVADSIRIDILRPLLRYNFGEEAEMLVPAVSLGDTERRDWASDAAAAEMLAPLVTDSMWAAICQQLGLPAPAEGETWPNRSRRQASAGASAGDAGDGAPDVKNMTTAQVLALHRNLSSALRATSMLRDRLQEAA